MKCPNCGIYLMCSCKACVKKNCKRLKPGIETFYVHVGDECDACSNCGHTLHVDQWLEIEAKCAIEQAKSDFHLTDDDIKEVS